MTTLSRRPAMALATMASDSPAEYTSAVVDEVDAAVDGGVDDSHRIVVVGVVPTAEHHRTEAQLADTDSGVAEVAVSHQSEPTCEDWPDMFGPSPTIGFRPSIKCLRTTCRARSSAPTLHSPSRLGSGVRWITFDRRLRTVEQLERDTALNLLVSRAQCGR